MSALTLESFKTPLPVVAHSVPMPDFGNGSVAWVAELTAWERETRIEAPWRAMKEATGREGGLRAFLVAACLCTDAGRTFMASENGVPDLADKLGELPLKTFDRLFKACERINGVGEEAQQELEKN